MRLLFLIAVLGAACAAQAQVKAIVVRPPASADERDERERDRRERDRHERRTAPKSSGTPPMMVVRPAAPPDRDRDDHRRWRERDEWREQQTRPKPAPAASKPSGPPPMTAVRPAPESTPPSKAEQMQRRMNEERRNQRGEQSAIAGNFRCNAFPVCDRSSGSYGSCRGVEQLYSAKSWREARQKIARDCAAANTPDPCNCASQCSRVAQCGAI